MIGHSFLHGGSSFSGLSLPVVTLLTGESIDTAASALTLEDCPDIDHRETIGLVSNLVAHLYELLHFCSCHTRVCAKTFSNL